MSKDKDINETTENEEEKTEETEEVAEETYDGAEDNEDNAEYSESDEEFEDDGEEELSQTDERTPKKRKGILKYIIMAVVLLVAVKWGIEYFSQDKMPETSEAELKGKIDLDTSSKYDFISFGNNVVMCNKYGVFAYNSGGKVVWQYETNLTSPVLYVCGDNLLVTDIAQSSARVFDLSGKLKNDVTFETECITASVNENGWITAILKLRGYRAQISVYDNTSKLRYSWNSANNDIITAALCKDNKTLAASQLDSSSTSEAYGIVSLFDITTDGKPHCGKNLENNLVVYMRWNGNKLLCTGSKNVFEMDKSGNENWSYSYPGELIVYNTKSDYALAFAINGNSTSSTKITKIYTVSNNGKELGNSEIEGDVKSLEVSDVIIEAVSSASIITLRKNASVKEKNSLSRDISKCCLFGSKDKVFVISGTTAEILAVK